MIFRHCLALFCFGLASSLLAGDAASAAPAPQVADVQALIDRQPMIFVVAKGEPNACGPGCGEWIAAEGMIDPGAAQRLRDFLGTLPRRDLPVFFNSSGGDVGQAVGLGAILREHRVTVGIGRTLADGCRQTIDEACRRVMQSKREHRARLATSGAICLSACAYALMGGSVRHVARDAQLGVHTLRTPAPAGSGPSVADAHHLLKRYLVEMGVDPGLIDVAAKVSPDRVRYLSRDEIGRFGIESSEFYETAWIPYEDVSKRYYALKAVTLVEGISGVEHRTRVFRVGCEVAGRVPFLLRRELLSNEIGVASTIKVAVGDDEFALDGRVMRDAIEVWYGPAGRDFARNAASAPRIVITETFTPGNAPGWLRVMNVSTKGLSKALEQLRKDCAREPPLDDLKLRGER
jgi:hypothetical protein